MIPQINRSTFIRCNAKQEALNTAALSNRFACLWILVILAMGATGGLFASEPTKPAWKYSADQMRPFWRGTVMEGESVLFIKDERTGDARASVLLPIQKLLAVRNSPGDVTYVEGRDYLWKPGSREIVIPSGSRIIVSTPAELRRPPKSQKYELTHRDGNGEILFGARLEYHELQTCITYSHAPDLWTSSVPTFEPKTLRCTVEKLRERRPLSLVVLGDSISSGCNASGWADGAPFQPAYPELVRRQLMERHRCQVQLTNLSVGGMDSQWGLTMIEKVVEPRPDLVIVAFGMNDAAGRSAREFQANIGGIITRVRERLPDAEFILVAPMLGNQGWTRLRHELFPEYRDSLAKLRGPGVALADLTSVWTRFLELKHDWDQTGNGVNHPNDFGHRVHAQVITTLLTSEGEPAVDREAP